MILKQQNFKIQQIITINFIDDKILDLLLKNKQDL